jgi:hypothetical protein
VCSTLKCDAMQWWIIVGSFLCAQLSAVHSNFLPESFMYEKLQSHHKPREGPFELNDIFAIIMLYQPLHSWHLDSSTMDLFLVSALEG